MTADSYAPVQAFREAMEAAGLVFKGELEPDSGIRRVHIEGDAKGSRNGFYSLHTDGRAAGIFGCWKRYGGERIKWVADRGATRMTPAERAELRKKIAADKARRAAEEAEKHAATAARAQAVWDAAKEAPADHPYLRRKGVQPHGARVGTWTVDGKADPDTGEIPQLKVKNALLIPITERKKIVSLQAIFPSDKNPLKRGKDYLQDGRKGGCYFVIGKPVEFQSKVTFVLCEGFATGASIHEATGLFTIVCFDVGNIEPVARLFRANYADARIVIAADNDRWTTAPVANPGVTKGRAAAEAVGGLVAVPEFREEDLDVKPTDFNDLAKLEKAEAVRRQIFAAINTGAAAQRDRPLTVDAVAGVNPDADEPTNSPSRGDARATSGPPKPTIYIVAGEHPRVVDEAEAALISHSPNLFQRGSLIVRPTTIQMNAADGAQIAGARLIPVKRNHMAECMTRAAIWTKYDARLTDWIATDCPMHVADTYLEREGLWKLRTLVGIINAPTLRRDGSILQTPGFDDATGLLYDPAGQHFNPIPKSPNHDDAIGAMAILKGAIATFPFVSDADRSVALSGIITTLVRRSMDTAPLHGFTAPTAGTGKSYLVDIASVTSSGRRASVISQGKTEEELEKRLGASLIAGDALISIDNCEEPVGGEFICQAMTQPMVKVRILGKSQNMEVPSNAAIFATGNNLTVDGDMTRRTIMCALDAGCERPETREFDFDPIAMATANRAAYVAAGLTILRAYIVAGRPVQVAPIGSFAEWSNLVRSAIIWTGEADPAATMENVRSTDQHLENLATITSQWASVIGDRRVSANDVISIANGRGYGDNQFEHPDFRESLLIVAGDGGTLNARRLGRWLGKIKNRVVAGLKIVEGGILSGTLQWKLIMSSQSGGFGGFSGLILTDA